MNIYIWAIGILNQLFIRGSYTQIKFSSEVVSGKSPFFVIGPFCTPFFVIGPFCTPHLIIDCLTTSKRPEAANILTNSCTELRFPCEYRAKD